MESHAELQLRYEDYLRNKNNELVTRITTAVDDYLRISDNGKIASVYPRIRISMSELRSSSPRLAQHLRHDPLRHLRALEWACHSIATEELPGYDKSGHRMKVSITGPITSSPLSPRTLTSPHLGTLICVEGVATKVSPIRMKLTKSVHYCPATKKHESRSYVDALDPHLGLPELDDNGEEFPDRIIAVTPSVYPTSDRDGNALQTEFGLSTYSDYQVVTLQEMPERAPMGQLPRSVELLLSDDLVDAVKPGDRVHVVGVFQPICNTNASFYNIVFVSHIQPLTRDQILSFQISDIRSIRALGLRPNILSLLGRSIAPFIHGHEFVKQALILQLLSGCEKNLANGTHLRGDINILLVGDPSTAKSQLLRTVLQIAPLAISTTGKGSSGVGLTAAVTNDIETRERRLEAGAMVLGDRGIVCIDEFDKMSEIDRVAIHEVMEQQTVTIAKAGIHATLNARCSVLAAANPVYGQYDRRRKLQENIGLPDSLLSRFDLVFLFLDLMDPRLDRRIATHVTRAHKNNDTKDVFEEQEEKNTIWQRSFQPFATTEKEDDDPHSADVLRHDFLRKYLHFAKSRYKPQLSEEAREAIAVRYAEMRSLAHVTQLPITARSLETIIRMATAHAKCRLSETVEADPDVKVAMDILSFALHREQNALNVLEDERAEDKEDDHEDDEHPPQKKRRTGEEMTLSSMKQQIWDEIHNKEESLVQDLEVMQNHSQEIVSEALKELATEGKIVIHEDLIVVI